MLLKIRGNAIKDSGKCSRGYRGMFRKIPGNAFNFKLIKAIFCLTHIFAMSYETIERSNKMIWYFHFLKFKLKRNCYDHGKISFFEDKSKNNKGKLKAKPEWENESKSDGSKLRTNPFIPKYSESFTF